MNLDALWRTWGDELPLWEASYELDPPTEERIDNAAWQTARAARSDKTIYRSEFDGTEQNREIKYQPPNEMAAEAQKIADSWPHGKEKKANA